MLKGEVLTITPIREIVLSGKYTGPDGVLTLLRLFAEPDKIYFKQGVGTHNRFAQALLGNDDYSQVASAGRLGLNYKQKGGVLVYPGGSSMPKDKGFNFKREEFKVMYDLIVAIMGSAKLVGEGSET